MPGAYGYLIWEVISEQRKPSYQKTGGQYQTDFHGSIDDAGPDPGAKAEADSHDEKTEGCPSQRRTEVIEAQREQKKAEEEQYG